MKRLTKKILEEARAMEKAWIIANPDGDQEWYLREIAGIKGVEYISLEKKNLSPVVIILFIFFFHSNIFFIYRRGHKIHIS